MTASAIRGWAATTHMRSSAAPTREGDGTAAEGHEDHGPSRQHRQAHQALPQHPHTAGPARRLWPQRRSRHRTKRAVTAGPQQVQYEPAAVLEIADLDVVGPGRQVDLPGASLRAVDAEVVQDGTAVNLQVGAVVRDRGEGIGARHRSRDGAGPHRRVHLPLAKRMRAKQLGRQHLVDARQAYCSAPGGVVEIGAAKTVTRRHRTGCLERDGQHGGPEQHGQGP